MRFAVVHKVHVPGEKLPRFTPVLLVSDAPDDLDVNEAMDLMVRSGRWYGDGNVLWGNYGIQSEEYWTDAVRKRLAEGKVEQITYAALLQESRTEKRMTVRMPAALHGHLIAVARAENMSMNEYIVAALESRIRRTDESRS